MRPNLLVTVVFTATCASLGVAQGIALYSPAPPTTAYRCYLQPGYVYYVRGYAYYAQPYRYCVQFTNPPQSAYSPQAPNPVRSALPQASSVSRFSSSAPPTNPPPASNWSPFGGYQAPPPAASRSFYATPPPNIAEPTSLSGNRDQAASEMTAIVGGLRDAATITQGIKTVLEFMGDAWDVIETFLAWLF